MSLGEVENFNALTDVGVVAADQAPFADDLSKVQARKDIVERDRDLYLSESEVSEKGIPIIST